MSSDRVVIAIETTTVEAEPGAWPEHQHVTAVKLSDDAVLSAEEVAAWMRETGNHLRTEHGYLIHAHPCQDCGYYPYLNAPESPENR